MKTLATINSYLRTASARKDGVERNVRSSSAMEGISTTIFRSAATGRSMTKGTDDKASHINERPKKK